METKETPVVAETTRKKARIPVGMATIVLDKDGEIIEAMFDPTIKVKDCTDLVAMLKSIDGDLATKSQTVMASWFVKTESIQLADREKYRMLCMPYKETPMPSNYPEGSIGHSFYYTLEEI